MKPINHCQIEYTMIQRARSYSCILSKPQVVHIQQSFAFYPIHHTFTWRCYSQPISRALHSSVFEAASALPGTVIGIPLDRKTTSHNQQPTCLPPWRKRPPSLFPASPSSQYWATSYTDTSFPHPQAAQMAQLRPRGMQASDLRRPKSTRSPRCFPN